MNNPRMMEQDRAISTQDFNPNDHVRVFSTHTCVLCASEVAYATGLGICEPCDIANLEQELAAYGQ